MEYAIRNFWLRFWQPVDKFEAVRFLGFLVGPVNGRFVESVAGQSIRLSGVPGYWTVPFLLDIFVVYYWLELMASSVSPTPARVVLGLLALFLLSIFAGINVLSQRDLDELLIAGEPISGLIVSKDCRNHGKVNYTYTVQGKQRYGSGSSCVPSCENAKVGDTISIIYSTKNIHNSECGSLKTAESLVNGNYWALFIAGVAFAIAIYRITKT